MAGRIHQGPRLRTRTAPGEQRRRRRAAKEGTHAINASLCQLALGVCTHSLLRRRCRFDCQVITALLTSVADESAHSLTVYRGVATAADAGHDKCNSRVFDSMRQLLQAPAPQNGTWWPAFVGSTWSAVVEMASSLSASSAMASQLPASAMPYGSHHTPAVLSSRCSWATGDLWGGGSRVAGHWVVMLIVREYSTWQPEAVPAVLTHSTGVNCDKTALNKSCGTEQRLIAAV